MTEARKPLEVYADGACKQGKGTGLGPGGWAVVVVGETEFSGRENPSTNNRMELEACIQGLQFVSKRGLPVLLYSDSAYVVNCIEKGWYKKWRVNGWITTAKTSVENRDRWERLLALYESMDVTVCKVKGHSDNVHNNRCDELAVAETRAIA